jgi:hypothetical protein
VRKKSEQIFSLVGTLIAVIGLAFTILWNTLERRRDRKTRTLDYVTNQFDRLANLKSREELSKVRDQNILDYITGDDIKKTKTVRICLYI